MGKINKYANLYDKNGNILRHTSEDGILHNITIPELEKMIDEYPKDGDALALDNMKMALFQMYNKYGDPHRDELIKRLLEEQAKKTNPEEVTNKLQELNKDLEENKTEGSADWLNDNSNIEAIYNDGNGMWERAKQTKVIEYDPEQHEANLNKYMQKIAA